MKKTVVVSDIHIPDHDPIALAMFELWCRDFCPDEIVLNGDIAEMACVSLHDHGHTQILEQEIQEVSQFLRRLRDAHPKAKIVYNEGNHEDRLARYQQKHAPALGEIVTLPQLLGLTDLNIAWNAYCPDRVYFISQKLGAVHGFAFGEHYAAATLRKYNVSVIVGHAHRPQYTTQPTVGQDGQHTRGCWGGGCLTEVQHVSYLRHPSGWTQGWTAVYSDDDGFSVYPVNMHKHAFFWDGKKYDKDVLYGRKKASKKL